MKKGSSGHKLDGQSSTYFLLGHILFFSQIVSFKVIYSLDYWV